MALALEGFHGPDPDTVLRAQRAFLAVNEVDRIILTGSGGNLQPFIPLDPFHGVHRAYAWQGVGSPQFVQVNATGVRHSYGRCDWTWPASQIHLYDRLTIVAAMVEPITGQVQDPAWAFPARTFRRIAYISRGPRGPQYWVIASPTGHDRFARYRIPLQDLWKKLAPVPHSEEQGLGPVSESTRDQGTTYEQLVAADLIRQSHGSFALYRPGMDIAGRDLLVQLVDSWRTISLQIKGTTMIVRGTRIQCLVKRWTFRPAEDFWFAFYFFDTTEGSFWKHCWLVPSVDFARLTADQHFPRTVSFQVTLKGEDNRWRPYRHEIGTQAQVLRKALLALKR
ncbi:MAG TPA: hypothetical protein VIN00_01990 [Candidatus Dormibacteraeota bacterium]|jgi:hypothetical protein